MAQLNPLRSRGNPKCAGAIALLHLHRFSVSILDLHVSSCFPVRKRGLLLGVSRSHRGKPLDLTDGEVPPAVWLGGGDEPLARAAGLVRIEL